jgi:hypothetical protein
VRARYIAPIQIGSEAHLFSFLGEKQPERDLNNPTHLAPRLKKEKSYTYTPTLDLLGLFWGEIDLKSAKYRNRQ